MTIRPLAIDGWMFTPCDADHHQIGREGLDVDLVGPLAVERVADHGPQLGQIDVIDAVADLFVAGEADADRPVRNLRMLDEPVRPFP